MGGTIWKNEKKFERGIEAKIFEKEIVATPALFFSVVLIHFNLIKQEGSRMCSLFNTAIQAEKLIKTYSAFFKGNFFMYI